MKYKSCEFTTLKMKCCEFTTSSQYTFFSDIIKPSHKMKGEKLCWVFLGGSYFYNYSLSKLISNIFQCPLQID